MTGSRGNRAGNVGYGFGIFPNVSMENQKSPNSGVAPDSAEFSLADVAAKAPLKVPALPENPLLARRYAPLGNTFLNWAGSDEGALAGVDEADILDAWELQSTRPGRHTFDIGQVGPSLRQNLETISFEVPLLSRGDLGVSTQSQVERWSFHSDSAKQADRMSFSQLDHTWDVNLERLDRCEPFNDHIDYMAPQRMSQVELEQDARADETFPTLEREPYLLGNGKSSRRNSFEQTLDPRMTREEDFDASFNQISHWGLTLASNDCDPFQSVQRSNAYKTFDSWQEYDDIDAKPQWLEEQPREQHPQRVVINDRMQTPNPSLPLRVLLADTLERSPVQQLGAMERNRPEAQKKNPTTRTIPPEGEMIPAGRLEKPVSQQIANPENEIITSGKPVTTLMVRNIPTWYTQEMLLNEWPNDGTYNLLYLPFCFRTKKNLAFAFVNFTTPEHAEAFRLNWHKRGLQQHTSRKLLDVSVADVQGQFETLQKLTKHKSCRIRNSHYQPAIFVDGARFTVDEYLAIAGPEIPAEGCSTVGLARIR